MIGEKPIKKSLISIKNFMMFMKTLRKYLINGERLRKGVGSKERCPEAKIGQNNRNESNLGLLNI